MRKLIHIPVLHSPESIEESGRQFSSDLKETAKRFWTVVDEGVERLSFQPPPHVYVESYTGRQITLSQLTTSISENRLTQPEQKIAIKMLARGGILETTEDPTLLRRAQDAYREYEKLIKQGHIPQERFTELTQEISTVSEERTAFTVNRIDKTLPEGGTGILLMGANHDITAKLPHDIAVESLDPRLREILLEIDIYRKIERERTSPTDRVGGENKG